MLRKMLNWLRNFFDNGLKGFAAFLGGITLVDAFIGFSVPMQVAFATATTMALGLVWSMQGKRS